MTTSEDSRASSHSAAQIATWVMSKKDEGLQGIQFYFPPASNDATVEDLATAVYELLSANNLQEVTLGEFLDDSELV